MRGYGAGCEVTSTAMLLSETYVGYGGHSNYSYRKELFNNDGKLLRDSDKNRGRQIIEVVNAFDWRT